jgi:hypothetical protein
MSQMLNMTFKHKLPIPMDIKAQFPITAEMQAVKEARDIEIAKVFKGEPCYKADKWPHLLLIYDLYDDDYSKVPEKLKPNLDLGADKVYLEMDVNLHNYVASPGEPEGALDMAALILNIYLAHKQVPNYHIYFAMIPFNKVGPFRNGFSWFKDSHSSQMCYEISQEFLYGGDMNNSFYREDGNHVMGEWKKIRVDITPHIDRAVEWANRDNIFGTQITKEDLYFGGANIGFEIHGNYDATFEHKNFNIVAYEKD